MTDDLRAPQSPEDALRDPRRGERALDQVVREAKAALVPRDVDWESVEARLMVRVRIEPSGTAAEVQGGPRRALRLGALTLAAAAAVAVIVRKDRDVPTFDAAVTARLEGSAGSLRATEGAGEVRVGGVSVSPGHGLRAGDVIEADGARAVLERPRKATWILEKEGGIAKARVKFAAAESLVLGLEDGAIEAQVTPVTSGEAFAVDVAEGGRVVRIAVHGTHLRVARAGSRVTVDLTEGVVSIGAPPRAGSTFGKLVTAPAHVELDAVDLDGTLRVDHAPASVRPALPLAAHEPIAAASREPQPGARVAPAPPAAATVPRPAPAGPASSPEAPALTAPAKSDLPPREAIATAVRDCAASRSRPGDVRVTVASSLELRVGAGGVVESAQFVPPLLPEIQTCAAGAIYRAKLEAPGQVTIPIEFSY